MPHHFWRGHGPVIEYDPKSYTCHVIALRVIFGTWLRNTNKTSFGHSRSGKLLTRRRLFSATLVYSIDLVIRCTRTGLGPDRGVLGHL